MSNLQRLGLFNVAGNKLSGFAQTFLRVCLSSSEEFDVYLEREETLQSALLVG
jgi:hypothetical protein